MKNGQKQRKERSATPTYGRKYTTRAILKKSENSKNEEEKRKERYTKDKREKKRKRKTMRTRRKRYDESTGVWASQLESRVLAAAASNHKAKQLFVINVGKRARPNSTPAWPRGESSAVSSRPREGIAMRDVFRIYLARAAGVEFGGWFIYAAA